MKKSSDYEKIAAAVCCLLTVTAFYIVNTTILATHARTIQLLMQVGVLGLIGGTVWFAQSHPQYDRNELFIWLIVALGVLMRIGYMLYTPAAVRGHDLGTLAADSNGHAAYIFQILNGSLPLNNGGQFYHPPLFHFLSAIAVWCYRSLSGITGLEQLLEAAKTVSCAASILTLFYARKLCRQLQLSQDGTQIALCLAAFLPNHYLLAGRVNNDSLAVLFMTAILYYTLRWYEQQDWNSAVKLALCFGLGMMTKISVGVLALVTGGVMLVVLYQRARKKQSAAMIRQYLVFGAIAFPLGLWYPIRNFYLFGQPLSYVLRISQDSPLYCGGYSLWQRFGLGGESLLYARPNEDYNVWAYLLRGSLFGEFSFQMGRVIPALLLSLNLLLILVSMAAMVYTLLRRPSHHWAILGCFWLVLMVSYISFNTQYPFGCTMDFRYIVPTALIGAVFLAKGWEQLSGTKGGNALKISIRWAAGIFSILSIVMYCNLTW